MGLFLLYFSVLIGMITLLFPQTEISRMLRRYLFNPIAHHLNRTSLARLLFFVVLLFGFMALSQAFPPGLALAAAGDIAAYVEVAAVLLSLGAADALRRLSASLKTRISVWRLKFSPLVRRRCVRRRTQRPSAHKPPQDDDSRHLGNPYWAMA